MKRILLVILPFAFPLAGLDRFLALFDVSKNEKAQALIILGGIIAGISIVIALPCLLLMILRDLAGWPSLGSMTHITAISFAFLLTAISILIRFKASSLLEEIKNEQEQKEER